MANPGFSNAHARAKAGTKGHFISKIGWVIYYTTGKGTALIIEGIEKMDGTVEKRLRDKKRYIIARDIHAYWDQSDPPVISFREDLDRLKRKKIGRRNPALGTE